jgi:type IV secretion system protein VirD4
MSQRPDTQVNDVLFKAAVVVLGTAAIGNWVVGNLAALLGRGRFLHASLGQALAALVKLPKHLDDPRLAWAPKLASNLPGPVVYWLSVPL